ncbi:hypothetical protein LVJ83_03675 [Uruburuella testudinis]|uniref:Uncharacterized protein n=1 Tax=Uruburuella testudinis TaxID=1282863 RepID=A0ABY4DVS3_9NEIS|nr:hypothetical protein [Uruburuella testudinis]UOO82573.1 hypothetical protein LVJ83_03675 [Uruburuella testudinis]
MAIYTFPLSIDGFFCPAFLPGQTFISLQPTLPADLARPRALAHLSNTTLPVSDNRSLKYSATQLHLDYMPLHWAIIRLHEPARPACCESSTILQPRTNCAAAAGAAKPFMIFLFPNIPIPRRKHGADILGKQKKPRQNKRLHPFVNISRQNKPTQPDYFDELMLHNTQPNFINAKGIEYGHQDCHQRLRPHRTTSITRNLRLQTG